MAAARDNNGTESPKRVLERFYEAEREYMQAGEGGQSDDGDSQSDDFAAMQATLDPAVVLHQSPDLPFGGEFQGHAGYRRWAEAMRTLFDRVDAQSPTFYENHETVVVTCELVTRIRATGGEIKLPMVQVVTVRHGKIIEFRPFYWNVPAYAAAAAPAPAQR